MYTSKLLELIRGLEKTELVQLRRFMDSPYFGKTKPSKEVYFLFQHVCRFFPTLDDVELSKQNTFAALFPGQTFNTGKLNRVMSDLLKIVREFVIYEFSDLKEDPTQRLLLMARFFRQRHMEKPFRRTIKKLKGIQANEIKTKDHYLKQFLIEQEISNFDSFYNHRREDLNLPATLKSLDIFYLTNKMEYTCWLLAQNKYNIPLNVNDSLLLFDRIIASFKEECVLEEIPLLQVYYLGIRMIQAEEEEETTFVNLKEILKQYADVIPLDRLKELQTLCRNYCIQQYNNGKEHYLEEAFTLYRDHLEQGYLFYEGGLLPSTIRNIVAIGLRLKKFDWVCHFLENSKDRIVATSQAKEIYHFNLANYFFALEKYDEALDCLSDRYEDAYYLIASKRMELKIYYELQSDILESRIDAFKIYIYRISQQVLPKVQKEGNNNFIDLLKQIRSPKTLDSLKRIEKLKNKVLHKKSIAEKEWLLEKLEEHISKVQRVAF